MTTATLHRSSRILERFERLLRFLLSAAGLVFAAAIGLLFASSGSWDLLLFLVASTIFVIALCLVRPYSKAATLSDRRAFLSASLVIWIFLMLSEAIFVHLGSTNTAEASQFASTAYYEALAWILSLAALAFFTFFRPAYLWRLFNGPLKWVAIFSIVAVVSCPLSPNKVYSLTMAFKLCVVTLTLFAIEESSEGPPTVPTLFWSLFVGISMLVVAGFVTPFVGPGQVFVGGSRFGANIGLSGIAGMLLLLSLLYFILRKNPWFLAVAGFALAVMLMAGGKGGILASFLSFLMFFVFLKNARQALAACVIFTFVFVLFVAFTPLGHVVQSYEASGNGSTLTGRTNLWTAVWPEIKQKPILGHGFRASRFVSSDIEGTFAEAGHIHNVLLEVLYNNGLAGLIPLLIMNYIIVTNLGRVLRQPGTLDTRYYAAAGLALYIHLLVWGITAPTFGSAADSRFMTFFILILVGLHLRPDSLREA